MWPNLRQTEDLVTFTEGILNGKLHFFVQWLKAETEGVILAQQDQILSTRNYQTNKLKNEADPRCCICTQYDEEIGHLISECP